MNGLRTLIFWGSILLVTTLAVSVTVGMATVRWLYPQTAAAPAAAAATAPSLPGAPVLSAVAAAPAGGTGTSPPQVNYVERPTASPAMVAADAEQAALDWIRIGGSGDLKRLLSLSSGLSETLLQDQVVRIAPSPYRVGTLPGLPGGPTNLLVWTVYRREGLQARGAYQLSIAGSKVVRMTGPLAPEGGYARLRLPPYDERGKLLDLTPYQGRGLVLVAPRTPEPGLLEAVIDLQNQFKPKGVEVVLVQDLRSPDVVALARKSGFTGSVWRLKGKVEDVPVVNPGRMLGAVGLLIDREGYVVSSLAALDPSRYGLIEEAPATVAASVFRAYGLLPQ